MQVTERVSEAAHSIVKRRSPPTAAAPLISLTLRLQDVARLLKIDSKALLGIGVHFERARHMQAAPGLVCLILISVMDPGSGGCETFVPDTLQSGRSEPIPGGSTFGHLAQATC